MNYPTACNNYRFGNPNAFGGHFEAYASGHLCHISGNSAESSLVSGAIKNILVGDYFKPLNYLVVANLHSQAAVMELVESDKLRFLQVPVWDEYQQLLSQAGSQVTQHILKFDHK